MSDHSNGRLPYQPVRSFPAAGERPLLAVEASPHRVLRALGDAWAGGPAVLPVDPALPPRRRGALIAALRPGLVERDGGPVIVPCGLGVADDTVLVIPTSGSTGTPRAVELTRAALTASVELGLARTGSDPEVPWLACLPVSHVAGVLVLLRGLLTGTPAILHDAFDAAAVAAEPGPVHLALVPTMLQRVLAAGGDPSRWRTVLLGGAATPDGLTAAVPGAVRTYGMTESSGGCVYEGVPLDGVEVDLDPAGRIRLRGPTMMRGYRDGGGLDPDGWFTTADLGEWRDGRLRVLGRVDDVIVTGGEKVLAGEVVAALERHPAVAEAAVVGVPDEEWGERVVAWVVPATVGAAVALSALRDAVGDVLPRHAAPKEVVVTSTLPRLPSGKVDRLALRDAATRGPDAAPLAGFAGARAEMVEGAPRRPAGAPPTTTDRTR